MLNGSEGGADRERIALRAWQEQAMPMTTHKPCTVAAGPSNRADGWVDFADPKSRFAHMYNPPFMQAIVGV